MSSSLIPKKDITKKPTFFYTLNSKYKLHYVQEPKIQKPTPEYKVIKPKKKSTNIVARYTTLKRNKVIDISGSTIITRIEKLRLIKEIERLFPNGNKRTFRKVILGGNNYNVRLRDLYSGELLYNN